MDQELPPRPVRRGPHWISISAAAAMLVPGVYCQLWGQVYRNGEGRYYGWPFLHPDNEFRFVSSACGLDLVCTLVVAIAAGFVVHRAIGALSNRGRFGLTSLFVWMAIVPPVIGVFAYFDRTRGNPIPAEFIDYGVIFDPVAIQYPLWISLPVCFGLTCLLYAIVIGGWSIWGHWRRKRARQLPQQR